MYILQYDIMRVALIQKITEVLWLVFPVAIFLSISAGQTLAVVLFALWLVLPKVKRHPAWPQGLGLPVGLFFGWLLFAAALSKPGLGDLKDLLGKWSFILLLPLAHAQAASGEKVWRSLRILVVIALAMFPYYMWSWWGSDYNRAEGLSGGSVNLGTILMMVVMIVLSFALAARGWFRLSLVVVAGLLLLALAMTLNRSAALGVAAGIVLIAMRRSPILLAGAVVLFVGCWATFPSSRVFERLRSTFGYGELELAEAASVRERVRMLGSGMRMVRDRPLLGFTSRRRFVAAYADRYRSALDRETTLPGHVHNSFLQTAVLHGVPGLGLLLWWLLILWRKAWALRSFPSFGRDPCRAPLIASLPPLLLAVLVNAQFDYVLAEGTRTMMFYTLVGLLLGASRSKPVSGRRK